MTLARGSDERTGAPAPPSAPQRPDPSAIRFYYINLDSGLDRRRLMETELKRCGLSGHRVAGVSGAELPTVWHPYFHGVDGRPVPTMTLGEIGCHAAHLAVCRQFLADSAGDENAVAVALEDDALLVTDIAAVLADIRVAVPPDWDIIRLSNIPKRAVLPVARAGRYEIVKYSRVPSCASGYMINVRGARKLLTPGLRIHPFDNFLRRPWLTDLKSYGLVPAPITYRGGIPSEIDTVESRARVLSGRRWWDRAELHTLAARIRFEIGFLGVAASSLLFLQNTADRIFRRQRR